MAWVIYDQYTKLYEKGDKRIKLLETTATTFFSDLNAILRDSLFIQICKLTDPAKTYDKLNLTTNYLTEYLTWPDEIKKELVSISTQLNTFREFIKPARHKILSHSDLQTHLKGERLGLFPVGAEKDFWRNLQNFVNIAHGHFFGTIYPIDAISDFDADDLIRALKKAVDYDDYFENKKKEKLERRLKMKFADA